MMQDELSVPKDAEELKVEATEDGSLIGLWRGTDGTLYVAYYHFGPSGVILAYKPDAAINPQTSP